ncbi:MAG: response regulator transcription factor [Chloroflexi bacterium]|jgi:DNA-binding response OmpR family regulator|nr:response regulator transcription factor [Anaerolineaceae bacterium]NMB87706.1 response regulator transcription factor [Chloroflexota bacterium]
MKILVIDDDPAMTELLRLVLEPASFTVITANTGPDGISLAHSEAPDVVILDLMMPDIDGWQVCKAIREFSSMPILILSALDSPGIVAEALNAGADDFLIKPIASSILVAQINKHVRRNRTENNNVHPQQTNHVEPKWLSS